MADALFLAIAVLTIGSAIAALELRSLIYGSIALMGTLGGVAGFFVMLDSPFVAMFQLAVYVGSIAVLILFTVMLVKRELIFIQMLEGLCAEEAQFLVAVVNQRVNNEYKGFTANLVKEAFNWNDNFMKKEIPKSSAARLV